MEHEAPAIFVALEQSGFAAAIRQWRWLYPVANVGHILSLICFASAVAVIDLRLLGAFAATAPGRLLARARIAAIAAFCGLAVTGFMLFSAEASHLVGNPVLRLKFLFVAAGPPRCRRARGCRARPARRRRFRSLSGLRSPPAAAASHISNSRT